MAGEAAIIEADALDYLARSSDAQVAEQKNLVAAQKITENQAKQYNIIADSAALIKTTEGLAALEAKQYVQRQAAAAGLNIAATTDEMTNTITRLNSQKERVRKESDYLREIQEQRFLDNPIKALLVPWAAEIQGKKVAHETVLLKQEESNLDTLNKLTGQAEQIGVRLSNSITQASIEATANVAAGEARIRAEQARMDGLKFNTAGVQAAARGSKERLDAWTNLQAADQRSKSFSLSVERFEQDKKEFDVRSAERDAAIAAKKEGKELDEVFVETLAIGEAALGMPRRSALEYKSAVAMLKTGQSKELSYVYEVGRRSKASGTPVIGGSPANTLEILEATDNSIAPARTEAYALLKNVQTEVLKNPTIDKKDKKGIDAKINALVGQTVALQYTNANSSPNNIFNIGDLGAFLVGKDGTIGIAEMAAHPLSQAVLIPATTAGQTLTDPATVLALSSKAVQERKITSSTAISGITSLYKRANLINQAALNLKGFGIAVPNDGVQYFAKLGMFGSAVDLTDPAVVARLISDDLARRILSENGSGYDQLGSVIHTNHLKP